MKRTKYFTLRQVRFMLVLEMIITVITAVLVYLAFKERGYLAFGGEWVFPILANVVYYVYVWNKEDE